MAVEVAPRAYILPAVWRIYFMQGLPQGKSEGRPMKTLTLTRVLLAAGLTVGLGCGMAIAQDAGHDIKDAGHATKDAAVDTGHATKDAAVDTAHGTKKVYHKTRRGTRTAYHKTVHGTKTATHRTENAGDALAGKPEQH
jgi:hypothetical protein